MNPTHAHLLLNHFPTIGMIVGLGLFVVALAMKSDHLKQASLITFFIIALLTLPTFATGTAAELALQHTSGVPKTTIETHETAAFEALWFMELTGAFAWLALWQYRRLSQWPRGTMMAVMLFGVVAFGLMSRAANIGGEIRHEEIRAVPAAPEPEPTPDNQPLARVIGDFMVNVTWTWAAAETIHFIGLSLLLGVVLVVDLRMLGLLKGVPFSALHRLLPWGMLGFAVNLLTGMLFFIGAPPDFYVTNSLFFWKLALILVAGANALYFTVFEQPWVLGPNDTPPAVGRVVAASAIVLWLGVLFCGQMLPFFGHSF
jgi:uncharacterized membrane protein